MNCVNEIETKKYNNFTRKKCEKSENFEEKKSFKSESSVKTSWEISHLLYPNFFVFNFVDP